MWKQISANLKIEIQKPLGQGGFATVFRGSYLNNCPVAVKELKRSLRNGSTNKYFEAEIELSEKLKTLNNPYLVSIYEIIFPPNINNKENQYLQQQESAYIVMELCTGDLKQVINGKPSENIQKSLLILRSIAEGLKQLHEINIVHRDLKPENIFTTIGPDGKQMYYKLGDFGLGKDQDTASTQIGTITYMAPEMLGTSPVNYNKKVDIWALGVMAHEIITGVNIFSGGSVNQIRNNILQFKSYLAKRSEYQQRIAMSRDQLGESFRRVDRQEVANLLDAMLQPDPNLRCDIHEVCILLMQTIEALDNPIQPVVQALPAPNVIYFNGISKGQRVATPEKKLSFNQNSFALEQQISDLKGKNAQLQSANDELNERYIKEKNQGAKDREASQKESIILRNQLFAEQNQREQFEKQYKTVLEEKKRLDEIILQLKASQKQAESRNNEMNKSFLDQRSKVTQNMALENRSLNEKLEIKEREIFAMQESQKQQQNKFRQSMDQYQLKEQKLVETNRLLTIDNENLNKRIIELNSKQGIVSLVKKQCQKIMGQLCPHRNKNNFPQKGY